MGCSLTDRGYNFAVFSDNSSELRLVLYIANSHEPMISVPLDPQKNRSDNIWHLEVTGLPDRFEYGYQVDGKGENTPFSGQNYPPDILNDPYARAYSGRSNWGTTDREDMSTGKYRSLYSVEPFDWENDSPLNIPLSDTIIYELHLRGYTKHPSSQTSSPGTYAGLIEKIPYLDSLGITTIELLPINEFDETGINRTNPTTGKKLFNFWGYDPLGYFAPKAAYASQPYNGGQITEFKQMVKEMHKAGIEVILDIVFNHTGEGPRDHPTFSFRGLAESTYYMIDKKTGNYLNFTGCGNTVNCNHPVVRKMILDALRYWVTEMHVDGFRFDLVSILSRDEDGSVLKNPPVIEEISRDQVLSKSKLIAEAWDAAGLYQVGSFPGGKRWAIWNDRFRDSIRKYIQEELLHAVSDET